MCIANNATSPKLRFPVNLSCQSTPGMVNCMRYRLVEFPCVETNELCHFSTRVVLPGGSMSLPPSELPVAVKNTRSTVGVPRPFSSDSVFRLATTPNTKDRKYVPHYSYRLRARGSSHGRQTRFCARALCQTYGLSTSVRPNA